jgi:hypothetical protein
MMRTAYDTLVLPEVAGKNVDVLLMILSKAGRAGAIE